MKGWECPKCGRVYAPHVEECGACNLKASYAIPVIPYQGAWWGTVPPPGWPKISPYGGYEVTCRN